jgi:beta-glucosidase-like glycosyl hydrolase
MAALLTLLLLLAASAHAGGRRRAAGALPPRPTHAVPPPVPLAQRAWLAPGQPIDARVRALLAVMTPDEKAMQLVYECADDLGAGWNASSWAATSIGTVGIECSGYAPGTSMSARIANLRAYQQGALAYSRLGLPVTFSIETSHCGAAGGTIFPMGATQGASWNVSLVGELAAAIAAEARAWGGSRGLSPEINPVTDPRFGRSEENWGEEPLLVARMARAAVIGLQGGLAQPTEYLPDPSIGLIAEAKHCCVYGFSGLDGGAADVSEKTLHDVYLKPWRAYIQAGGRGMMMSHNELNGVPMHANGAIMRDLFRGAWNYSGYFGSDYGNIGALTHARVAANITQGARGGRRGQTQPPSHTTALLYTPPPPPLPRPPPTLPAAAALAISAGMDQAFCDSAFFPGTLNPALAAGTIAQADVDRAVYNVLAQKFAAGLFDGQLPDPANRGRIYTPASRALARRAAAEGAVLLRNSGVLPLNLASIKTLAVIGPNSGCAPPPPPPPPAAPGACAFLAGTDCSGNDLEKINGVTSQAACCALCVNATACAAAVLATDQDQCLLKSACAARTPNAARVLCDPGKAPPPATPWTCEAMRGMLGGYSNLEQAADAAGDNHAHVVTVLEAAQAAAAASGGAFNVTWAQGAAQRGYDASGIAAAAALAGAADAVVLVLGDGGEAVGYDASVSCGEGADRPSLDLPGVQLALLEAVLAAGRPTALLLFHGRPVTFGSDYGGSAVSAFGAGGALDARAGAVLAAWRPGCEGGGAMWDLLTGAASPSGRLAQSWPVGVGGVRVGGLSPGYIKFSDQGGAGWTLGAPFAPNYALGHGLDYLAVSLGASAAAVDAGARAVRVSVALHNAAPRAGAYVVQVYFMQHLSRYTRYQLMLGGFEKVWLAAASDAQAQVQLAFADMAYYDPVAKDMVLEAGDYTVVVCASLAACDVKGSNAHVVSIPATLHGL